MLPSPEHHESEFAEPEIHARDQYHEQDDEHECGNTPGQPFAGGWSHRLTGFIDYLPDIASDGQERITGLLEGCFSVNDQLLEQEHETQ